MQHEFLLLDHTKNGEQREISINATLRATLQELFKGTSDRPQRIDVPNVFYRIVYNDPTEKTKPTGKAFVNVQKSFIVTCRRAKLKHFRSHDLRHTFASQLVMAGIDITTVKELLGHKTLTMTLRYAHLAPSHKVKAVDILDQTLTNSQTAQLLHRKEKAVNE